MHSKEAKALLSAHNGINIARGCLHGCIYCDSRSDCYRMDHDFEDIELKTNAPQLLAEALAKKRKKCMIGTGSMSDPYLPLAESLRLTRSCLEIIAKNGFGLSIQTKSARILDDLDLLQKINARSKCVVSITLTTYDENLCRILEPNVSTTAERFEVLLRLKEAGIPTIVWLCPILPFINDTDENLYGLLTYCQQAQVKGILNFGFGLTLRDGNREYFYRQLDINFPGLKKRYEKTFRNAYSCLSPRHHELNFIFKEFCKRQQLMSDPAEIFNYINMFPAKDHFEQLTLF